MLDDDLKALIQAVAQAVQQIILNAKALKASKQKPPAGEPKPAAGEQVPTPTTPLPAPRAVPDAEPVTTGRPARPVVEDVLTGPEGTALAEDKSRVPASVPAEPAIPAPAAAAPAGGRPAAVEVAAGGASAAGTSPVKGTGSREDTFQMSGQDGDVPGPEPAVTPTPASAAPPSPETATLPEDPRTISITDAEAELEKLLTDIDVPQPLVLWSGAATAEQTLPVVAAGQTSAAPAAAPRPDPGAASVAASATKELSPAAARRLNRILDIAEEQKLLPEGIERDRIAADIAALEDPESTLRRLASKLQSAIASRNKAVADLTASHAEDRASGDVGMVAVSRRAARVLDLPEYQAGIAEASMAFERLPDIEGKKNVAGTPGGQPILSGWAAGDIDAVARAREEGLTAGNEPDPHPFDQGDLGQYENSHSERQAAAGTSDQHFASSKLLCPACQRWFSARATLEGRPQFVADPSGVHVFMPDGRHMLAPHPSGAVTMFRSRR